MEIGKKILLFTQVMIIIVFMMIISVAIEKYSEWYYTSADTIVQIKYDDDIDQKLGQYIDAIRELSVENNVNFIQKSYISNNFTGLYVSNILDDRRFKNFNGQLLVDNNFISSKDTNDNRQIGHLKKYISDVELRIYDISNVELIGLENEIYLYGVKDNSNIDWIYKLSEFGDISVIKARMTISQLLARVNMSSIILLMPLIALCLLFMFIVINTIFIRGQSKLIGVCKLVGKSPREIVQVTSIVIRNTGIIKANLLALIISIVIVLIARPEILLSYFIVFIVCFISIVLLSLLIRSIITIIVIMNTTIIDQFNSSHNNSVSMTLLIVSKIVACIILLVSITNVYTNFEMYDERMSSMENWTNNNNIHKIIVSSEASEYRNDLVAERNFNERCSVLYNHLLTNNNAFIIDSRHFLRITDFNNDTHYVYEKGGVNEKEVLSPYRMSIVVDEAYLKVNKIISYGEKDVRDELVFDPNVMNIIVPNIYRQYESKIYKKFQEYFYFQKVTVDNIYNEEMNTEMNKQDINELVINIIYSRDKQNYFTYSSSTGDLYGNIEDPIAIVYNPAIDPSNIMSLMTSATFFVSERKDAAYFDILDSIKTSGVKEVRSTRSIYSDIGNHIKTLKIHVFVNFLLFIISSTVFVTVMIQHTFLFCDIHKKRITIRYLNGLNLMQQNIYIKLFVSNIIIFMLTANFVNNSILAIVIIILTSIEIYFVNSISQYNTNKHACYIVKG